MRETGFICFCAKNNEKVSIISRAESGFFRLFVKCWGREQIAVDKE